jgi:surface polysaccharide O-acyltransferase-like enzyme
MNPEQRSSTPPIPKRSLHADVIRAWATVAVVLLHASVLYVDRWQQIPMSWWWIGNLLHSLSRCAVPLFIFLSGALLLGSGKTESLTTFWRKRLAKLLIPFGLWSIVYLICYPRPETLGQSWLKQLIGLIQQPAYGHLWFLYMILGLYLVTPVLRIFARHADRATLRYYLVLWFIFSQLIPFAQTLFKLPPFYLSSFFNINGFIGLFILGHYLETTKPTKRLNRWAGGLTIVCWIAIAIATALIQNPATGKPFDLVYEVNSPLSLGLASGLFLWLKGLPHAELHHQQPKIYRAIGLISSASFTIYLAHMLPVVALQTKQWPLWIDTLTMHPLWLIPILAIGNLFACLGLHQVLRRLPGGNWLAP